ncbi:uncharacterized protein LTR77_007436 [Saxophila tyrrhenica]|uniref:JmjC domain-containing protein n=1 Tax=Saxophila tyrrhenica TaxID=1690608 RepID=A0AAV9P7M9_9PEZI|nr:hypothetical protein LTR77_007436 [Saxophila tyrrhenica]
MENIDTAIAAAIENYHELNAAVVDELVEEPSPLEFMQFVSRNRPFVVRKAASDWDALKHWDAQYLRRVMGSEPVQVAVTPRGNADAVVEDENGQPLFVQPHETPEPFNEFLDYVHQDTQCPPEQQNGRNVKYAQTRTSISPPSPIHLFDDLPENDNLREEYYSLLPDIPESIPFARLALEKEPDAINLWIGNERSVTALHKDNYENIYVQIRGQKHFVLLSPVEMPCVNEQLLEQARYVPEQESGKLVIERSEGGETLPFATWDPDEPGERTTPFSHLAKPLKATLEEGDMLYLPAMWYHKVSQTAGEEGFACAVNAWYDMEFAGGFWTANSFLRDVMGAASKVVKYPALQMSDER